MFGKKKIFTENDLGEARPCINRITLIVKQKVFQEWGFYVFPTPTNTTRVPYLHAELSDRASAPSGYIKLYRIINENPPSSTRYRRRVYCYYVPLVNEIFPREKLWQISERRDSNVERFVYPFIDLNLKNGDGYLRLLRRPIGLPVEKRKLLNRVRMPWT